MNKLTANVGTLPWLRMMLVLLTVVGFTAAYAQSPVKITQFYPDKSVDNIQQLKRSTTIYVYLQNLTQETIKATALDMRLVQDGNVLADDSLDSGRVATMTANGSGVLSFKVSDYDFFSDMEMGLVTLQVYGVTYTDASGATQHYTDASSVINEVTYQIKSRPYVVSTEGFEDGNFRSYYPEDGEEGVLKLNISVPIQKDGISAYLTYGTANLSAYTDVPWSVSEDRQTVSIDFRGEAHTSAILSQGLTFTDDNGDIIIPTRVSLTISGMRADDGSLVEGEALNPSGNTVSFSGAFFTFNLIDESFPTPVIRQAKFFNSADPNTTYNNILDNTDMMVVTVSNNKFITYCDMVITCGDVKATVYNDDIVVDKDTYTVALPENIRKAGSSNMIISLENVEFISEDGVDHIIKPLEVTDAVVEVFSVAEAKALEVGTDFILNTTDLVVSFSNGGYIFVEDATGGVRILQGADTNFEKGVTIVGKFAGSNVGGNSFSFNAAKSEYVTTQSSLYEGVVIEDLQDALLAENQCRYISVVASKDLPITLEDGVVLIGESLIGVLDLYQFEMPEEITSVTGVLYEMSGTKILIVADFNLVANVPEIPLYTSIAALIEAAPEGEVYLDLNEAVVTYILPYGDYFLEDATGALMMSAVDMGGVPAMGTQLQGEVKGVFYPQGLYFEYNSEDLVANGSAADVSVGTFVSPEDILSGEYAYRLVTVTTDYTSIIKDGDNFGMVIGKENPVYVVDMFGAIEDWTWDFPAGAKLVTGIVYPMSAMYMDDNDGIQETSVLAIRSEEDVVALDTFTSLQDARLNAKDGDMIIVELNDAKLTYSMGDEAFILEDSTGAMMVCLYDNEEALAEGTCVNGPVVAMFSDDSKLLNTYPQWCQWSLSTADVSTGLDMSPADIFDPLNDCRLVTVTTENHSIDCIEGELYLIDEEVFAALLEATEEEMEQMPEKAKSITGIIYRDYASEDEKEFGDAVIIIRSFKDIVADSGTNAIEQINEELQRGAIYNLQGIQMPNSTKADTLKGVYIVNGKKVILKK